MITPPYLVYLPQIPFHILRYSMTCDTGLNQSLTLSLRYRNRKVTVLKLRSAVTPDHLKAVLGNRYRGEVNKRESVCRSMRKSTLN